MEYDNEFMPDYEKEYNNEFLEDESFHPKNSISSPKAKTYKLEETAISPAKRFDSLRDKCIKKLGKPMFEEMYSLMR